MDRKTTKGITIDGPISKDLDDGFWLTENEHSYTLTVSIADVASMVNTTKNGNYYDNAFKQIETLYFSSSNDPMLPRFLSENKLSLLPGALRPSISFTMTINKTDLEVSDIKIERSKFKSLKKMNFEEVDILVKSGKGENNIDKMLLVADHLAQNLLGKRRAQGALAIYDINKGWYVDEEGRMLKMSSENAYRSYVIIQEFMILTNASITEYLLKENIRLILRNHTARTSAIPREELMQQLAYLALHPSENQINMMQKKLNLTMDRAKYATTLLGHYGLNLPAYAHWTSPIRRFADLVNHIILHAWLDKERHPYTPGKLDKICAHINTIKDQRRDEKKEFFKLEGIRKNGGLNGGNSPHSGKKLMSSLKMFIASKDETPSAELIEAIQSKMSRGALDPREFFLIFFNAKFAITNIRTEALESLSKAKHLAVSVLMLAEQLKLVSLVLLKTEKEGRSFKCEGSLSFTGTQFTCQATHPASKKEARFVTSLNLLSQIIGYDIQAKGLPVMKIMLPLVESEDYISALHNYNNIASASLSFETKQTGLSFQGIARVIVNGKSLEEISEWFPNKKLAKKQASEKLYKKISEVLV